MTSKPEWLSDNDSFFAHQVMYPGSTARSMLCGVVLKFDTPFEELHAQAEDKPRCSACTDGVRVVQG